MLVCAGEHDEIDRRGALDILTVEKLRNIEREHEDWIRRVTGLDKNRNTVVLRMIGKVRGNAVELTRPTASDAILRSDERYPDFPLTFEQQGIEIDLRHIPAEPGRDQNSYMEGPTQDHQLPHPLRRASINPLGLDDHLLDTAKACLETADRSAISMGGPRGSASEGLCPYQV
jgi:hypothetical protein